MDDLSSVDWNAQPSSAHATRPPPSFSDYSGLRAAPFSSTPTPQPPSRPASSAFNGTARPPATPASPANDSFSNLLSLNAVGKASSNLTLQDRQKQLLEERRRQVDEQKRRQEDEFRRWEKAQSNGTATFNSLPAATTAGEDVDDILAAFNSAAPVDRSSHFPPPSASASGRTTPAVISQVARPQNGNEGHASRGSTLGEDDDDPFGLGAMPSRPATASSYPRARLEDDDDILGDLGRPVTAKPPPKSTSTSPDLREALASARRGVPSSDPLDRPMAELIDMGFPTDRARGALLETGGDVQSAVSFLINHAHDQAKQRTRQPAASEHRNGNLAQSRTPSQRRAQQDSESAVPTWMRQESRPASAQSRDDSRSPEKDVAQYATDIGSTLLKSANSLWKTGQKRMQKAVAELQQDGDPKQPKWMRDVSTDSHHSTRQRPSDAHDRGPPQVQQQRAANVTDEALLLDSGAGRPQKTSRSALKDPMLASEGPPSRGRSPAQDLSERPPSQPRFMHHAQPQAQPQARPPTKLSRQQVDDEASLAYVSSSRRRRPAPMSEPEPAVDLFGPPPEPAPLSRPLSKPSQPPPTSATSPSKGKVTPSSMPAPRPEPPRRTIPPVSPQALSSSSQHRRAGGESFKRGDYAAAHESYTAALSALPPTHAITIIILSNRALTAIKTGDPKTAVSDADRALKLIGPSRGEGETIDLGAGEGSKDMNAFHGKALMRKAEALENMEKWADAAEAWREAVAAGVGGAISLRGRDRCGRAATSATNKPTLSEPAQSAPHQARKAPPKARPATARPPGPGPARAEAVAKLRAANAAAEKADDEKFELADSVSARVDAWKGGKSDNLRALLATLDAVLWPAAGWKKVGMADLVIPARVKIIYMKAIAKVHPDKDATTEQRMISATVFSTLNEAWDKFKSDNGL